MLDCFYSLAVNFAATPTPFLHQQPNQTKPNQIKANRILIQCKGMSAEYECNTDPTDRSSHNIKHTDMLSLLNAHTDSYIRTRAALSIVCRTEFSIEKRVKESQSN